MATTPIHVCGKNLSKPSSPEPIDLQVHMALKYGTKCQEHKLSFGFRSFCQEPEGLEP